MNPIPDARGVKFQCISVQARIRNSPFRALSRVEIKKKGPANFSEEFVSPYLPVCDRVVCFYLRGSLVILSGPLLVTNSFFCLAATSEFA